MLIHSFDLYVVYVLHFQASSVRKTGVFSIYMEILLKSDDS